MAIRDPYQIQLLDGPAVENSIRLVLSQCKHARIAVAYWGRGAVERLNLEEQRNKDVKIVCDLGSGACNPRVVQQLIEIFGADSVRTLDGMHAKIWITDAGCVLGSSNASANGLGYESNEIAGLVEANVVLENFSETTLAAWRKWYDEHVHAKSVLIDDNLLQQAENRWLARRAMRDNLPVYGGANRSLLANLRECPGYFCDKRFIVSIYQHGGFSKEAERGLRTARIQYSFDENNDELDAYENWRVAPGTTVLDFDWDPIRKQAILDGLYKIISDRPFRRLNGTSITLCMPVRSYENLKIGRTAKQLAAAATEVMQQAKYPDDLTIAGDEFGRRLSGLSE